MGPTGIFVQDRLLDDDAGDGRDWVRGGSPGFAAILEAGGTATGNAVVCEPTSTSPGSRSVGEARDSGIPRFGCLKGTWNCGEGWWAIGSKPVQLTIWSR